MNAFNRALMTLLGILLALGGIAAAFVAWVPDANTWARAWLPFAAQRLQALLEGPGLWLGTGGILAALLGALLLLIELLTRPRSAGEQLLLREDDTGEVAVLVDSMRRLADHVAAKVPNVREVQSRVVPRRDGLHVRCRLAVDPAASLPDLAREVQSTVGAALEHHLGQPVEEVSVAAQITPLSQPRRRRVR